MGAREAVWRDAVLAATALAIAGAMGACRAQSPQGAASGTMLQVSGDDSFRFSPAELRVRVGQPVAVEFQNTGQILHDFSTRGQARNVTVVATPGQTRRGTFTPASPGRYEFFCGQAGHEPAGMKGVLVIE